MINEFKVGGIYMILYDEDLYPFYDQNKSEYKASELRSESYEQIEKGTILTYIKTITEIGKFRTNRHKNAAYQTKRIKIPVFYYQDRLVIPYTAYTDMLEFVKEVVDESP